jgi:hypothetical protein
MTMGIFWLINLTKVTDLDLVKLDLKISPNQIG